MTATQAFEAIRAFDEHEHRELPCGLSQIPETAGVVGAFSHIDAGRRVHEVVSWLASAVEPHIGLDREEQLLLPLLESERSS